MPAPAPCGRPANAIPGLICPPMSAFMGQALGARARSCLTGGHLLAVGCRVCVLQRVGAGLTWLLLLLTSTSRWLGAPFMKLSAGVGTVLAATKGV
jgi:hypothetical protein